MYKKVHHIGHSGAVYHIFTLAAEPFFEADLLLALAVPNDREWQADPLRFACHRVADIKYCICKQHWHRTLILYSYQDFGSLSFCRSDRRFDLAGKSLT